MTTKYKNSIKLTLALLLMVAPVFVVQRPVGAADLANRSIAISTATAGSVAQYTYQFDVPTAGVVGSMAFEYCSNSPLSIVACTAPAGLDVTSASLSTQTGNAGFSIDAGNSSANKTVLTRAAAPVNTTTSTYAFTNVLNPSAPNQTVFVRIATYASIDGSGAFTDYGAVAFSTVPRLSVDAYVPPYITFCLGVTVSVDCSSVNGARVSFGELQKESTVTGSTQFSGATNDYFGLTVFVNGQTLTAGNVAITPLATNSASVVGQSQFGLNLRANTVPAVGVDPQGIGTTAPLPAYSVPNSYRFVNGEAVALSPTSTDFTRLTVSYIVNIPQDQAPGIYTTTLTYTAVASF